MIRAHLSTSWPAGIGLNISIVDHDGDGPIAPARRILHYQGDGGRLVQRWDPIDEAESVEATLHLEHYAAIALMQALNTHFDGVDDQRTQRTDYVAERARVDKLTDAIIDIAKGRTP